MIRSIFQGFSRNMKTQALKKLISSLSICQNQSEFFSLLNANADLVEQLIQANMDTEGVPAEPDKDRKTSPKKKKLDKNTLHFILEEASSAEGRLAFTGINDLPHDDISETWANRLFVTLIQKLYQQLRVKEETMKYQVALEILVEANSGLALINLDRQVTFCNSFIKEEFDLQEGQPLPEALNRLIKTRSAKEVVGVDENELTRTTTDYNFFYWNEKNYHVTVRLLDAMPEGENAPFWSLSIQPAVDAFSRTNRLAKRVGLSWREVEICSLLHDGLDPNEVSNRLFISKHTVKTYLKRIYRKCGVHSRAQLIALLNQYSGNKLVI